MALFKSKAERRIERNLQVQRTLGLFAGHIKKLGQQEEGYIRAAREALRAGAPSQLALAKKALKVTLVQRQRLEQQMLTLKIAQQMKDQAEAHAEFAKGLKAAGRAIAEAFGATDFTQAQKDFELAMAKAQSMEQRVDLFMASTNQTMLGESMETDDQVQDAEIDRLIEGEAATAERTMDDQIEAGLKAVQDELSREHN